MYQQIILIVTISFLFYFNSLVFAQTEELISVKTAELSYDEGDTVVISGEVKSIILDTPVTIQIFHKGNLVEIAQLTVAQDGKYTHTILAEGPLWKSDGTYTVRASYGTKVIESNFEYFTKQAVTVRTNIFEVDAGASGTFDVDYTIRGGTVKDMIIDPDIFALIVIVDSETDGEITLDLPRNSIDAKKSDGSDDTFLVFIDGAEVRPEETSSTADARTLTIEFEEGDSDIEIIGTFVIPEFGNIALLILFAATMSAILLSSKKWFNFSISSLR